MVPWTHMAALNWFSCEDLKRKLAGLSHEILEYFLQMFLWSNPLMMASNSGKVLAYKIVQITSIICVPKQQAGKEWFCCARVSKGQFWNETFFSKILENVVGSFRQQWCFELFGRWNCTADLLFPSSGCHCGVSSPASSSPKSSSLAGPSGFRFPQAFAVTIGFALSRRRGPASSCATPDRSPRSKLSSTLGCEGRVFSVYLV